MYNILLLAEATDVIDKMEDLTHLLIDKQNGIKKIESHIDQLEQEIANLKQTVQLQHQDVKEETCKVKYLEKNYEKQKGQLSMLQRTITSITENKGKLREMAQSISPNVVPLLDEIDQE